MPAPFLNPLVPGLPPAVSAWVRGLEEVEEYLIGGLVRRILGSAYRLYRAAFSGKVPE